MLCLDGLSEYSCDVEGSNGLLFMFDLTNRSSFASLDRWMERIGDKRGQFEHVQVLVGNKCDLADQRAVSHDEAGEWAKSHGMAYFETTTTDHSSVRAPIDHILRTVFEAHEPLMTPLVRAASKGDVASIERIVGEGENINVADDQGCTLMHHAVKNGHVNTVEALVRLGSTTIDTPNNDGCTPMETATLFKQASVMEALVRLGSQAINTPNNMDFTPIIGCAREGQANMVEVLARLDSNLIDHCGKRGTPMLVAATWGHVNVIEALVRLGSKTIDTPDNDGRTPIFEAAANGHDSAVELLVRLGSKAIDTPDNDGQTPIDAAAANGHDSAVELLVRLGSKAIDTPDNKGHTPMHSAIEYQNSEVVEALVRLGSRLLDAPNTISEIRNYWRPDSLMNNTLKALGVSHPRLLEEVPSEDEVVAVRYRVYFSRSLTNQLLFQ